MEMEQFITYIDEMVKTLQDKAQMLAQSDRKDESNLVKIQLNIYGVCKSIYHTVCKISTPDRVKENYLEKLEHLPDNWRVSLEKAKAHDDIEKIVVEELKLETLSDVKNKFLALCK